MPVLHPESLTDSFRKSRLVLYLIRVEGFKKTPYGTPRHIGVGHLLDQQQTENEIQIMSSANPAELSEDQIYDLLYEDVSDAFEDLALIFSEEDIQKWDNTRQIVMVSQAFQFGPNRLKKFAKQNKAVKKQDWETAAAESLDSLAAKQTPSRWQEQAEMLRLGDAYWTQNTDTPQVPDSDKPVDKDMIKIVQLAYQIKELTDKLNATLKGGE